MKKKKGMRILVLLFWLCRHGMKLKLYNLIVRKKNILGMEWNEIEISR